MDRISNQLRTSRALKGPYRGFSPYAVILYFLSTLSFRVTTSARPAITRFQELEDEQICGGWRLTIDHYLVARHDSLRR